MGAHEELEHAEHTAHSGGGHTSKHLGITMALLAVLIAFCAAMVGSQRQELMTELLDQSWAHASFTAASIKYRMAMSELDKMHGAAATPALNRALQLAVGYDKEHKLAEAWDNACDPLIDAHFDAAEGYEHGQLIAEIAIVIASVAVLLNSRIAWLLSVAVGVVCVGFIGYNYFESRSAIAENHEKVHHAEKAFEDASDAKVDLAEDEKVLNELDPGGKIRATFTQETKPAHEAEKEKKPEAKEEE